MKYKIIINNLIVNILTWMGSQKRSCSSCDSEIIKINVVNVFLNSGNLAKLKITRVLPITPRTKAIDAT